MPADAPASVHLRLPERMDDRALRLLAGTAAAMPWFDRTAMYALRQWFFPMSRLWAAAREAHADPDMFYRCVPMGNPAKEQPKLRTALSRFEEARAAANAIEASWDQAFFGADERADCKREAIEAARISLRHAYNATRRHFRFLVDSDTPRIKPAIASVAETEAVYGAAVADGIAAFVSAPSPMPPVEVSRTIEAAHGRDFWLRFRSPSDRLGDMVYARVHEPRGVQNPPTIIFGHGICVEFDHWHGLIDECHTLARLGFRVIRPEAAWHGRRTPPGRYGGEATIAQFPMGALDAVFGAAREWAVLADWARATSEGPLTFGGSSLGAMTSQFAADCAIDWPEHLRPQALLLLTHTRDLSEAVLNGALAELFMSPADVAAHGWSEEAARRYLSLLQPARRPCVPAGAIVSVLGRRDAVLPFGSGRDLVEEWCIPEANVFVWDRGHFSVPMTLVRDDKPLRRFADVVAGLRR